jgi:hypothetical protein
MKAGIFYYISFLIIVSLPNSYVAASDLLVVKKSTTIAQ